MCWEKSDGNCQGPSWAIAERRSPLSKPHSAAYDRRNAGADGCHPPAHQSLAASMGAQSRDRATAPSERSKKKLRLRGISSRLSPVCRVSACMCWPIGSPNTMPAARWWANSRRRPWPLRRRSRTMTLPGCISARRPSSTALRHYCLRPCWVSTVSARWGSVSIRSRR